MPKHSPSGIALLKQQPWGKNKTNPEWTDRFLENLDPSHFEAKEPIENEYTVSYYKGFSYKITKEGKLKSLSWEEMKSFFHPNKRWPRVRIKKA